MLVLASIILCPLMVTLVVSNSEEDFKFINYQEEACTLERHYVPSDIELYWKDHIDMLTRGDQSRYWKTGCEKMKEHTSNVKDWLQYAHYREKWPNQVDLGAAWSLENRFPKNTLSYYSFTEKCGKVVKARAEVPIEPLMGFLRHPLHICFHQGTSMDEKYSGHKGYLLPMFHHELYPIEERNNRVGRKYFFDLGASLYNLGLGGSSQKWFVETYFGHGIDFDRIFAWEVVPYEDSKIYARMPPEVISKMSFYNIPADPSPNGPANPFRIMQEVARPDDTVVIKIDIDNDPLELEFIKQILSNRNISVLIDELYFEHHVEYSPMEHYGWNSGAKLMNLTQSYGIFSDLRKLGIRAHAWV
mmetsp:Transcript_7997/g.13484  ORF Transcript_7997/g.13484 Transcript_7997/m.13484 type:complete len:359 (+) Transcript_7997:22-1098(+)